MKNSSISVSSPDYKVGHFIKSYDELTPFAREKIYYLRKRVFIDRLKWRIDSYESGEFECDSYDDAEAYYICTLFEGDITGCVRLRPSTSPTLLAGPLKWLKTSVELSEKHNEKTWEASRFFITPNRLDNDEARGIDCRTYTLFLSMIEFGDMKGFKNYEVVVDATMARVLRRCGWPLEILNSGLGSLNERLYYGLLSCSPESYNSIKYSMNKRRLLPVDMP